MASFDPNFGLGTLATHACEGNNSQDAHATPIFETSTFDFPDVASGAARFHGDIPGYIYTRLNNPNLKQLGDKIAILEGIDLLRQQPGRSPDEVVAGQVFASGMAAVTSAILAQVRPGQVILAQESLYSATRNFLEACAPPMGIEVGWVHSPSPEHWREAFQQHPNAVLAYTETPSNPTMALVDLAAVAEIAHQHGAWLMVDNTFASPYCQRPLSLGADVVLHSTTKYLSGHGLVIGGAVVSRHPEYVHQQLHTHLKIYGGSSSPFDAWLTNNGLKTFEVRMQRHCENALQLARFLEGHPAVAQVSYPGLESHPDHALARRQMLHYGGMISFELKGGYAAGVSLLEKVKVCTLTVSLGTVDSLICHPASMTHSNVSPETRQQMGISDGLVRFSVGIENLEDLQADLDQALR